MYFCFARTRNYVDLSHWAMYTFCGCSRIGLRATFGSKSEEILWEWRKQPHNLYVLSSTTKVSKPRRIAWLVYSSMGQTTNAQFWVLRQKDVNHFEDLDIDGIKINHKEMRSEVLERLRQSPLSGPCTECNWRLGFLKLIRFIDCLIDG